jgi:glyoxylase-like metal-dependent hydrolase (beta-lactamase superfamily II)/rhodanese-related sulfurtransferase
MALLLKQYYLGCLAHASYLVADTESGVAAVVDPQRDVEQYAKDAAKRKLRIKHVLLTHFHADFISGHLELRRLTGATIHLGARAKAAYRFHKLADGDRLSLGRVSLEARETPGHTPEAVCFVVREGEAIKAALTGDTLFIGDVGRPDLMASAGFTARQLASQLYDSLRNKLLTLPDETLVYPAHGAGSLCGRNLSTDTVSTIGREKRYNYALKPMTRAAFITLVTADQPEAPAYFAKDAALNRQARPTLERALSRGLKPLTLAQARRRAAAGAQLLDTRDPAYFAAGHIPGSLNIGLGGKFATFAGMLLDLKKPIVVVAEKGKERESALRLARVGFDRVAGYLDGGAAAAHAAGAPLASFPRLSAEQLRQRLASRRPPAVLDVRGAAEREASAIRGSVHIPLGALPRRLGEVPKGELVVTCAGGYRSAMAVSLLLAAGRDGVADLDGGMGAWNAAPACAKA